MSAGRGIGGRAREVRASTRGHEIARMKFGATLRDFVRTVRGHKRHQSVSRC